MAAFDPRITGRFYPRTDTETRHFYYSTSLQVLEERVDSETDPAQQFLWGIRFVDDLVLRDRDTTGNGTLDERLYGLSDPRFSVVAIADDTGAVQERYAYAGYGRCDVFAPDFRSRAESSFDWEFRYTGRRLDLETGMNFFRARYYHAELGRFISRDPIGYVDGMNLYRAYFVPTGVDPTGRDIWIQGSSLLHWSICVTDWELTKCNGKTVCKRKGTRCFTFARTGCLLACGGNRVCACGTSESNFLGVKNSEFYWGLETDWCGFPTKLYGQFRPGEIAEDETLPEGQVKKYRITTCKEDIKFLGAILTKIATDPYHPYGIGANCRCYADFEFQCAPGVECSWGGKSEGWCPKGPVPLDPDRPLGFEPSSTLSKLNRLSQ